MVWLLFQIKRRYLEGSSIGGSNSGYILLGILIISILLGLAFFIIRKKNSGAVTFSFFNRSSFKKIAQNLGLQKNQIQYLEEWMKKLKVKNPILVLENVNSFSSFIKNAIQSIDESSSAENIRDTQKSNLFVLKHIIDRNRGKKNRIISSQQLRIGQKIIFVIGGVRYTSVVAGISDKYFCAEPPRNRIGDEIRWNKNSVITVNFWKENGEGYVFETKVAGYGKLRGLTCVYLNHSNHINTTYQRNYKRKALEQSAYFSPIHIMQDQQTRKSQAHVQANMRTLCTMLDISAGGCSLRSSVLINAGELCKITFDTVKGIHVSVFGKVKNVEKDPKRGGIMHVQFTQASKANMNKINEYIYDIY